MQNYHTKNVLLSGLLLVHGISVLAQDTIQLRNPSFEAKMPGIVGLVPEGWLNLGAALESPPDIQPGCFGVTLPPQDGMTYLGLVVRENNTVEKVSQQLDGLLKKDSAYSFSMYLTRSPIYRSITRTSKELVNFDAPTVLKIWGYNTATHQKELLIETSAVPLFYWTKYNFILQPKIADFNCLDFMAHYELGFEKTNGNLLMDNCSAIVKVKK